MTHVDGPGLKSLQNALLDAYPTRSSLERMVLHGLNRRLNEIAAESLNLRETTDNLIKDAETQGYVKDLIEAAREENPDNPKLKALPPPSPVVRARRKAHHYPRHAYALFIIGAVALVGLTVTLTKANLTAPQLMTVKGALGISAAVLVFQLPKRWRLRVSEAVSYGGAFVTFVLTFVVPASAGVQVVSGRVFYEGTKTPVPGVTVLTRASHQKSAETGADGTFVITHVPTSVKELYVQWGGGDDIKVPIEIADGGEYAVIPKPPKFVETRKTPVPASAWKRVRTANCAPPRTALRLDAPIPAHPSRQPAYVEIAAPQGITIFDATTANPSGGEMTLSPYNPLVRRWEFPDTAGPVQTAIVVCLERAGRPPAIDELSVTYWYVERK